MNLKWKFLTRLWPASRRPDTTPSAAKRRELLSTVSDNDNCLRAVHDQLQDLLEGEFMAAIDPQRPAEQRLRACEGMRVAYYAMTNLEREREVAQLERQEREAGRPPADV